MNIPLNPIRQPITSPLELCKIRLYSTGVRGKVFTNHFYKSINHNFGVEILVKNNTSSPQKINVGGCIYDDKGSTVVKWKNTFIEIQARSSKTWDFYVFENHFTRMKEGKYKVQFWINNKRVQREFFKITYK